MVWTALTKLRITHLVFDAYAEIFAKRAQSYHMAMQSAPRAREAEFRAVLEPLDDLPPGALCDVPSGGCYLACHVRPEIRYLGIEPTEDFFRFASASGVSVLKANPSKVPLPRDTFDYIVSLAGLHHEPNLQGVFREMRRLVRRQGRVVIADVAENTPPARFLDGFVAQTNPLGHDGWFLCSETIVLLQGAGLRVLNDELIEVPWVFDDLAQAENFAAQLFGTDYANPTQVADALFSEVGCSSEPSQLRVHWSLRRIICTTG